MSSKIGQSTVELSLVVGMIFLLLVGIVRIMGWFNSDMAGRQDGYLVTRVNAGSLEPGVGNPYRTPKLSVLREESVPPYSVPELLRLIMRKTTDPQEVIEALEEEKRRTMAHGAPYSNYWADSLDEVIHKIETDPDFFNPLVETDGFEPMTGKAPGDGWWANH